MGPLSGEERVVAGPTTLEAPAKDKQAGSHLQKAAFNAVHCWSVTPDPKPPESRARSLAQRRVPCQGLRRRAHRRDVGTPLASGFK